MTIKLNALASRPPTRMVSRSNLLRLFGNSVESRASSKAATFRSFGRITRSTNFRVQSKPFGSLSIDAKRFSAGDLEPSDWASISHFSTNSTAWPAISSRSLLCTRVAFVILSANTLVYSAIVIIPEQPVC